MTGTTVDTPFSEMLRSRTMRAHGTASGSAIVREMLSGNLRQRRFAELTAQYHAIYWVLEAAAEEMRPDPLAGEFVRPELTRTAALEADLAFLAGEDWRETITILPATQRYVERLQEVAFSWPAGFVAHHYVRYMGDLSGGAIISKKVGETLRLDRDGIRFYQFDAIPDANAFKNEYRARLDRMELSPEEQERVIQEALLAYSLNTAVLAEV